MLPIKNGSFFIWVFLVSIFTIQFLQSQAQFPLCNPIDRSSLLSFFSNITSTPWQSSPSSDCCGWEGISCSPINGRITRVELPYRGLFGTLSIPSNLTALTHLNLSHNRLYGNIPNGFFSSNPNLEVVDLSYNRLTGVVSFPDDDDLAIQIADFSSNLFHGEIVLPAGLAWNLTSFNVSNNSFVGLIPSSICSIGTTVLDFSFNDFSGSIPPGFGNCSRLEILRAGFNNLSGLIPDDIYRIDSLQELSLSVNHLTGSITDDLVNLVNLKSLELFSNQLVGPIPEGIGKLEKLENLQLHVNNLTRFLPLSLANCTNLVTLILRVNSLAGQLDSFNFSKLQKLTTLDLGNNNFTGNLPSSLFSCTSLTAIYLGNNSLSGKIPEEIGRLKGLHVLDFSSNNFSMTIPDEISNATDNFSQANIVGCGGFGLVYKATLANGTKLAVKKLSGDFGLMEREFKAEIEALSTAQHENLVSLQGYCVFNGFRLLIYSYMENGSLDYWLHEKTEGASQLDWPTRLKIAKGASIGLAYMHQVCEPHIVHRDIKSSNILLDEKFEAHVADFGLARLIRPYCTHVTTELVGTLGYIPPEYGQAWIATLRGDVYSFGVVMLELLSGKRPVEVFKPKMSRELVAWVYQMRSEGKQEQVFDPILRDKGHEDEMLQMLDVACMCVSHNPRKRPSIQEVVDCLKNIGCSSPQKEELTL
ncbi:Tyrosine-sulfated glycopeptide receptor 1 [Linum perenne]